MRLLFLACLLACTAAAAEGPGTRIRSGDMPRVPQTSPRDEASACARLRGAERERCLDADRRPVRAGRSSGPESTGMGSGAGSVSSSGASGDTGGAGSFGTGPAR